MIRLLSALVFALSACIATSATALVPLAGDWDGNGVSTVGLYSHVDGTFALNNINAPGPAAFFFGYGPVDPNLVPLTGDWDGNSTHTPGIYDPATSTFYLRNSNTPGNADIVFVFGAPGSGMIPIVGDWDSNGTYTPGLYDPATGAFFLRNSNSAGPADLTFTFGVGGVDVLPIVGDWDGNGTTTAGLYDRTTSTFFLSNANAGGNADFAFTFGAPSPDYLPIAGNWDGASGTTVGLYNQVSGAFFLRNSNAPGFADVSFNFGPSPNTPPVLAGIEAGALAYTEGGPPVAITATLTVTDDGPTLASATVQLTGNCQSGEDVLGFVNQNGIGGVYTAGSCLMTLTGTSSVANYQAALRSVTYSNSSSNPSTVQRTASFQANDGIAASNTVTRAITVNATNNAPVVTAGGTLNYTENGAPAAIDASVTVTDADSVNLVSATVQITGNCQNPQDVLSFSNPNGISGAYTAASCLMTLTGSSSVANYQTALRSVQYSNSSENPSTATRTVTWIVNDGALPSAGATSTINVTAVNDAPTLAVSGNLTYTENQAATSLISSATITDADSANLTGATVQITGNYANGQDVLSYVSVPPITGSFNAGTGTLTLTGTTTLANYQTALASVKYANTSENPSTALRTVTWQVNDGGAANNLSNTPTSTITVIAVNDPPTATGYTNLPAQAGIPITYPAGKLGGTDPEGTPVTIDLTPINVTNGTVTLNADGSFVFTPLPLAATASFQYRVTDSGNPPPSQNSPYVTVSFTVTGPAIFFVKNPAVGSGNCTLGNECTLATAVSNIGAATNTRIFIEDANNHAAVVPLTANSWLIGQGVSTAFDTLFGINAPVQGVLAARPSTGQPRPTVQNTVTVNTNSTVRGLNIATGGNTGLAGGAATGVTVNEASVSATTATAISFSGTGGTMTLDTVSSTGGTNNLTLANVTGTLTMNGGALSGASARAVDITGGTASITYAGTIANSASGIAVANMTAGSVTFSGATKTLSTATNTAVNLTSNTNATVVFTNGGLVITTTTGTGFNATGGGFISVQGTGNTITSSSATALNVNNTTIGAGALTFLSISSGNNTAAGDPVNGIVLNTTGATAGLTVTGNGNATLGGNGSGGVIQNTTGDGILLTNTLSPSFTNMTIQGSSLGSMTGSGIRGTQVTNFTFASGTINNVGHFPDATNTFFDESNIRFDTTTAGNERNLSGVVSITNSILNNATWHGIDIQNFNGTISDLTISGNSLTSGTTTGGSGSSKGSAIRVGILGSAATVSTLTKATIANNSIDNFPGGGGIQVLGGNSSTTGPGGSMGTPGNATNIVAITGNSIAGQSAANGLGTSAILFGLSGGNAGSRSTGNFNVSNNGTNIDPLTNVVGTVIGVGNNGYATMTATISNNVIVANNTVGSNGIGGGNGVVSGGGAETPDLTLTVTNNTISNTDGNGILLVGRGTSGIAKLGIRNNVVAAPTGGVRQGIRVDAGNAQSLDDAICLDISGNTSAGSGAALGIGLRKQGTTSTTNDFGIEGMAATSTPGVEAYVNGLNPAGGGTLLISATSGFTNCNTAP